MKLSDILSDLMGVADLLKPHVRDDGDQYHAQISNSLAAAHGAALEVEAAAAAPVVDPVLTAIEALGKTVELLVPSTASVLTAIEALGKTVELLVPSTAPVLDAIEALGSHLADITAVVQDVKAALSKPAAPVTPPAA